MVVWGSIDANGNLDTGGLYDPITDTWTSTSNSNAPSSRYSHTAVWTGSLMVVWGGAHYNPDTRQDELVNTGGRYDPASDTWTSTSTTGAPSGRFLHTAVWTGSRMVVWGGFSYENGTGVLHDNADPAQDRIAFRSTMLRIEVVEPVEIDQQKGEILPFAGSQAP